MTTWDHSDRNPAYWQRWYNRRKEPVAMGNRATYHAALAWLDLDGHLFEDWGGGTGYCRKLVKHATYRVIDGTRNRWADVQADLTRYRSEADSILIRHVLEHNPQWQTILFNAVASYRHRLVVILFTPLVEKTVNGAQSTGAKVGRVPCYSFALGDLLAVSGPLHHSESYRNETLLYYEKPQ